MPGRPDWKPGQRVTRIDSDECGTVADVGRTIKVKWDSGRTSYFARDKPANVRLSEKK